MAPVSTTLLSSSFGTSFVLIKYPALADFFYLFFFIRLSSFLALLAEFHLLCEAFIESFGVCIVDVEFLLIRLSRRSFFSFLELFALLIRT